MMGLSNRGIDRNRGERGSSSIVASIFIALLLAVLLFGTKFGLPSDLVSLFQKMRGIQVKPGEWRPYTSTEGGYVIDMPGEPSHMEEPAGQGSQRKRHISSVIAPEKYVFTVMYEDFRELLPEGSDTEAFLAAMRDSMVTSGKGRLASDKPVRLDRFPGREFLIEGSGIMIRTRIFLKDACLYSAGLRSTKAFVLSPDADRFFASFKFIAPVAAPVVPGWTEFVSSDGRFSVQMPGLPISDQHTFKTRSGDMILYLFNLDHGRANERFSVQYTDYPEQFLKEARSPDAVLKKASTVDAFNIEGKVVSEKAFPLGRHRGKELQVENAELAMRIRLYLVDRRLYKVVAVWPKSRVFSADDERFLNSFQLTQ